MNLPNSLTVARLIMIPVFLLAASMKCHYADYIAAGIFITAAITDGLDGYLARKKNQTTLLGQFLDPVADKILVAAALIILVEIGRIPGWIAIIIVSREIAVTGLRTVAAAQGIVIAASCLGKIKTVTQIIAISAFLLDNFPFYLINFPFAYVALTFAMVFTLWSGVDYYLAFRLATKAR
ncbi:CDP-diacylglycerol--glycerol-3-phosphate 3-phosphatidyltransferase [Pelotomaculum sp. FP]|uniref:CDP-diacylglycerol--glycerol-3-phosphate 3-phosphatidyltransferase n=1 Tax=Pelotomaculum sp. FP TaxID=261474 RepID=UPI0010652FFE|nr:CDP-diacylglycerol--glycerol-3-phosphate 3-phosphatidyltransferase [Pelotomaculum sp. FP]